MAMKLFLLSLVMLIWLLDRSIAVQRKQYLSVRISKYATANSAYMKVPTTTEDPDIQHYEKVCLEDNFTYPMHLYCLCNDSRWCILYDYQGFICGMQISYPASDVAKVDPKVYKFSYPNFIDTFFSGLLAKSIRIFITNPDKLTERGRNSNTSNIVEGLWAKIDGKLARFDRKCQPNSPVLGDFTILGCAPEIGQLYGRNMDERDTCVDSFYLFLFYEDGHLVGFGHGIPGIMSPGPKLNVYNYPNGTTLQRLLPYPPSCLRDMYGIGFTAVGIWIIEDPWNIRCPKCYCGA